MIKEIRRKLPIHPRKDALTLQSEPSDREISPANTVYDLPIDSIIPNRSQPRSCFNQNAILRLSDSIRRYGILQPLTVRKVLVPPQSASQFVASADFPLSPRFEGETPSDTTYLPPSRSPFGFSTGDEEASEELNQRPPLVLYELIAGERRLRAAKLAELTTVPCMIVNTDDSTSAELAIVENLLREDLNMFEQAEAFRRLIDEFMLTQEEVARRVSLSQSAVANKLRILRLTRPERELILQSGLTERHARALLKISDPIDRFAALRHIVEQKWNVSNAEAYIDQTIERQEREKREASMQKAATEANLSVPGSHIPADPLPINSFSDGSPTFTILRKGAIRDIRLFYNSIRNAASILEQTGSRVDMQQVETERGITFTIHVSAPQLDKPI